MKSLANLLRQVVDYAGLFPPAALPMQEVVINYANYLKSHQRSMLGRLIVPAMKLADFEDAARPLLPVEQTQAPWTISALVPPMDQVSDKLNSEKLESALLKIAEFNKKHKTLENGLALVDAIEVKTASPKILEATADHIPAGITAFCEIPFNVDPVPWIRWIANAGSDNIFAKIRTGGVTPDLIPTPQEVARFITTCARHKVGFKATAGLHHPIRAEYRLTYEPDSLTATMHGFLNVFIAAAFSFEHQISEDQATAILTNTDPSRFRFNDSTLIWENLEIHASAIEAIRSNGITSFGSCSFDEPTGELQQLPAPSFDTVF